jgi:hypothetical protein
MALLGSPIAIGFTAEIYAWKDGQVLKLFNQGISRATVEYKANLTRMAHATGLPIPGRHVGCLHPIARVYLYRAGYRIYLQPWPGATALRCWT